MRPIWLLILTLLLGAAADPLPHELVDASTTEGWIWQQVQAGKIANLNGRCGTPVLDIRHTDDARWRDDCRRVDPALLRALLTQPDLADHSPHGVIIRGPYIDGRLNLNDAHVRAVEVDIGDGWIAGDLVLSDARFDGVLAVNTTLIAGQVNAAFAAVGGRLMFSGSVVRGGIQAASIRVGSHFLLRSTEIGGMVFLRDARIDSQMDMGEASIAPDQAFDAQRLRVGSGGLFLRKVTFGGPVVLLDAEVDGQMDISGSSIARGHKLVADRLRAHGGALMHNMVFGGSVNLRDLRAEYLSIDETRVASGESFDAQQMHVGAGGLSMRNVVFGGDVDLLNSRVDGQMDISGARFAADRELNAQRLSVGLDLIARDVSFSRRVELQLLRVDGVLDVRGARLQVLHLEDANIRDDLLFGGLFDGVERWVHWEPCDRPEPCLNLRNAKVGNLQDDVQAWPTSITLEGFTYARLGGAAGEQRQDMRNRPVAWWRGWLDRDPVYSAQPYAQLASVLAAAGNRDGAADIRFFGRDRERSELLRGCRVLQALGMVEPPRDDRPCEP